MTLNKIIIWGHSLHSHTHSYIHNAFYITFKYLGYETYWFNDNGENNYPENGKLNDFDNSLFIVHNNSQKLILNDTSFYICHYVDLGSNQKIPSKNILSIRNTTISCNDKECPSTVAPDGNCSTLFKEQRKYSKIYKKKYYWYNLENNIIYLPWATDLLPEQIDKNIDNLENIKSKNISNFIGMTLGHWGIFAEECKNNGIEYKNYGGTFNKKSERNKSVKENMELIQESIIAPALQEDWQVEHEYIPCRIFKNISYGKMGITNNKAVNELFDNKLIYSEDIGELVKKGLEFERRKDKIDIIKDLMIEVRDNHTYINRINFILDFLKEFKNIEVKNKKKNIFVI